MQYIIYQPNYRIKKQKFDIFFHSSYGQKWKVKVLFYSAELTCEQYSQFFSELIAKWQFIQEKISFLGITEWVLACAEMLQQ